MSKPTKEIIECARKLHDLGVRKDPEIGDWITSGLNDTDILLIDGKFRRWVTRWSTTIITIPPLEWCLEWLAKNVPYPAIYADVPIVWYRCTWLAQYRNKQGLIDVFAESCSTPHLAVLKAMLAVKESDNES